MRDQIRWPRLPADRPCTRVCPDCECVLEQHHEGRCGLVHYCPQCGDVSHHLDHRPGVDPFVVRFNKYLRAFVVNCNRALRFDPDGGFIVTDAPLPSEAKQFVKLHEREPAQGQQYFWDHWGEKIFEQIEKKAKEQENGKG